MGISFIKVVLKIAGAVFLFAGSKTILYFLILFFLRKDSIINNFKKYNPSIYRNCLNSVNKAKLKFNTYFLNKASFIRATAKSFDYAILEKTQEINAIKLDIPWSDLGSWKEILKMYDKNKNKYIKKKKYILPSMG